MQNATIATTTIAATETSTKSVIVPVLERKYVLAEYPATAPKGKQRQIVLAILKDSKKPLTPVEIAPLAETAGLKAIGGVLPSVRYHLHHMVKLGIATIK